MRSSVTKVTLLAITTAMLAVATGCEDGPAQTFSTAPNGAGSVWNGTPGVGGIPSGSTFVSPATQGYDASVGGQNASQLCTAAQQKTVWTANFNAPIIVPGLAGGLDIAGGIAGSGGIASYDPACLSYESCSSTFVTPVYEPTKLPPPYWTNPNYNPAKESWVGMTIEQAEGLLCQPANETEIFGGNNPQVNWGEQGEFGVLYDPATRLISNFLLLQGYNGLLNGTNTKTNTTYTISMQNVFMTKQVGTGNAQDLVLNWTDGSLNAIVNDMYEAFRQTFIAGFPADVDCIAAGHCQIINNGADDGIIFFSPLNLAIYVETTVGTPAADSIPLIVQLGVLKVLPFSGAAVTMKLDSAGVGPIAVATGLGPATAPVTCTYHLGMAYGDPTTAGTFEHDCVQANPGGLSDTQNLINQNKLVGAMSHGDENYIFNIQGVDPQFTATLTPTTVIADGQFPSPQDIAYELTVDQNVLGPMANDYTNNDATKAQDWHGIGLVTLEWANIVQQYMKTNFGVTQDLGDPGCIANPVRPPLPEAGVYPPGTPICSGLEGIVTTAPPGLAPASMAPNALGPAGLSVNNVALPAGTPIPNCKASDIQSGNPNCAENEISTGLKPGTWYSLFCADSGGLDATGVPIGYQNCIGGVSNPLNTYPGPTGAFPGAYFDTIAEAVAISYGHTPGGPGGQPIPELLQNRRFYFQQWILAMIKYLETADVVTTPLIAPPGMPSIDSNAVDPNELFFDTFGGQGSGFEAGIYVDRLTVNSQKQAPTALTISVALTGSQINAYTFDRFNFRGEAELYNTLKDNVSDQPGAEPVFLSNLVGSPVLQQVYGPGPDGFACATATAATATCPSAGPLDGFGNPLYAPYADSFGALVPATMDGGSPSIGSTVFGIPAFGGATENQPSGLSIDSSSYQLIQSAMVTVPVISPPASYLGAVPTGAKTFAALLPFLQGATIGFPVTIDGSRDKFYNTFSVDFTGTTVNGNIDYEYVPAGSTNLVIRAIETQNYLGMVFPCYAANPVSGATDILGVRMYDNGADILSWISGHPGAATSCGIQIKFSIYGNVADYISFGINPAASGIGGVRIGLNPGYGGSVVSDMTVFDPNIVASLGL